MWVEEWGRNGTKTESTTRQTHNHHIHHQLGPKATGHPSLSHCPGKKSNRRGSWHKSTCRWTMDGWVGAGACTYRAAGGSTPSRDKGPAPFTLYPHTRATRQYVWRGERGRGVADCWVSGEIGCLSAGAVESSEEGNDGRWEGKAETHKGLTTLQSGIISAIVHSSTH